MSREGSLDYSQSGNRGYRNETNIRPVDSTSNLYRVPLPQPYYQPTRQVTMWDLNGSQRHTNQNIRQSSEHTFQQSLPANNVFPYQPITGFQPLDPTHDHNTAQQIFIAEPDEDPMQHLVLVPLGKTGAGKSSLLNLLLGYDEFKAKAGARSVTDCITERTGVWAIDQIESIITVADTPGFADSMQRDTEFLELFRDYILDLGGRLGIDAFLLVFQYSSSTDNIMSILEHFNNMMQKFQPNMTWWNHVLLVFSRVDYYPNLKFPPGIPSKKQSIAESLIPEIQIRFNLESPPKYAFVSSKAPNCSLKSSINSITTDNGGRWVPSD